MNNKIEIPRRSSAFDNTTVSSLLFFDKKLAAMYDAVILPCFADEAINEFWHWIDRMDFMDIGSIVSDRYFIYWVMLNLIFSVTKNEYPEYYNEYISIIEESSVEIGDGLPQKYEDAVLSVWFLKFSADKLKLKYSDNVYKATKNKLWDVLDVKYKKSAIIKIFEEWWFSIELSDFMDFLAIWWWFETKNIWVTKNIMEYGYNFESFPDVKNKIKDRIETLYELIKNKEFDENQIIIPNTYIYNIIVDFFADLGYEWFDTFMQHVRDSCKKDNNRFVIKNVKKFIEKKYKWNKDMYIFIKPNEDSKHLWVEIYYDWVVQLKNTIIVDVCDMIWEMPKLISTHQNTKMLNSILENPTTCYKVELWLNMEWKLGILVYIKYAINVTKEDWSSDVQIFQNLFSQDIYDIEEKFIPEILTYFGKNNDSFEAVGMKKDNVNYGL